MKARLDYAAAAPEVRTIMLDFWKKVEGLGLEHSLLHLVYLRASQINGCGFCVDMHSKDMRAIGESEERVYMVSVWRESGLYSPRERAALAWTEAVTRLASQEVGDDVYAEARAQFDEKELVDLTLAIIAINGWNRLNVAFRTTVGDYVSPHRARR